MKRENMEDNNKTKKKIKHKEKVQKEIRKRLTIMIVLIIIIAIGIYKISTSGVNTKSINFKNKETVVDKKDKNNKMIKVNDTLYMESGEVNNVEHYGMPENKILTSTKRDTVPQNNDESNFGKGFKYVIMNNKEIHVSINGKWYLFKSE